MPPPYLGSDSGELPVRRDIREEQSEELGLLSQLLFIFCALISRLFKVSAQIPACSSISTEGRLRAGNSPRRISFS